MPNPLVDFAIAREQLRIKKAEGEPPPWTKDKILQTYRFTNIRRRDDRVSRWLLNNVYNHKYNKQDTLILLIAFCRCVNWPPTIRKIINNGFFYNHPTEAILSNIGHRVDALPGKVWTGAYMVRAKPAYEGQKKGSFVLTEVVGSLVPVLEDIKKAAKKEHSRRAVWEIIKDQPNWGSFMAGQVVDDLTWTPILTDPVDDYTWAPQGPGSLRGFNRVLGVPLKTRQPEPFWCETLAKWRWELIKALGPAYETLTLMDLQNCACEYFKYSKVQLGEGRPRSKYKPETAY